MSNRIQPYTYLLGWSTLGVWYYGYRAANKVPPGEDLWKIYFTSSKYVREFVIANGDPDIIKVDAVFETKKQAQEYEENYIQTVGGVKSENWLNRSKAGKTFRSPDKFSEESRLKMRDTRIRNGNTRKKPFSPEELENSRKQLRRINELGMRPVMTDELRAKLKDAASKRDMGVRRGHRNSPEHQRKINESKMKYRQTRVSCCLCKSTMSLIGFHPHIRAHRI